MRAGLPHIALHLMGRQDITSIFMKPLHREGGVEAFMETAEVAPATKPGQLANKKRLALIISPLMLVCLMFGSYFWKLSSQSAHIKSVVSEYARITAELNADMNHDDFKATLRKARDGADAFKPPDYGLYLNKANEVKSRLGTVTLEYSEALETYNYWFELEQGESVVKEAVREAEHNLEMGRGSVADVVQAHRKASTYYDSRLKDWDTNGSPEAQAKREREKHLEAARAEMQKTVDFVNR